MKKTKEFDENEFFETLSISNYYLHKNMDNCRIIKTFLKIFSSQKILQKQFEVQAKAMT